MAGIRAALKKDNIDSAISLCKKSNTPFSDVVHAGLIFAKHTEKEISNNMERTIVIETNLLEDYTTIVGTIGSVSVYIGLFGTVLGIIKAFNDISAAGTGGINVVINGIAESLVCTAAGLCVAVPAVVAYNYFIKRIDRFITDMELCASETMDIVKIKAK
jgi:biopolymer transport protein ExbB